MHEFDDETLTLLTGTPVDSVATDPAPAPIAVNQPSRPPEIMRDEFHAAVRGAMLECPEQMHVAAFVADVNGFSDINFRFGHRIGDALLAAVSAYIKGCLRPQDQVWRIGDDEFGIVLTGIHSPDHARLAAEKISKGLNHPVEVLDTLIDARVSIGIALNEEDHVESDALVRQASMAMRRAKERYSGYAIYCAEDGNIEELPPGYTAKLRRAISENRLEMYYQAKVDFTTDRIAAAEALVRWNDPELGSRSPDEFVTVAERSDLINLLTRWTINAGLSQCAQWHQNGIKIGISINLSARSLTDPDMPALTQRALDTWRIDPSWLTLEITETAMMAEQAIIIPVLERLSAMGMKLSIDDFGTGYSSLSYLRSLPVDELKIDKSFVLHLDEETEDQIIVKTIIELGKNFGLSVTAEGIENPRSYEILRDLNCDMGQGFYITRPMRASDFTNYLAVSNDTR